MELIQNIPLSIKFILEGYGIKKKDAYTLYMQVILDRKKSLTSLKMFVKPEEWDFANECFYTAKNFNIHRNNKLREIKEKIMQCYIDLQKSGTHVSAKTVIKNFKGEVIKTGDIPFTDYYRMHIDELKQLPNEYGEGVIGHYEKTQTHLHRFLKVMGWEGIKLHELSCKFVERFEHYMLITPNAQTGRPMNGNTSTTYIRKIKASVNAAVRKEIIKTNPLAGFKTKTFKQVNKVFLTAEEVELLKHHDLGGNLSLQRVRDCFLFCCYTGLRHSDVLQLSANMIKKDKDGILWIVLKQQKTSENIEIPMLDYAVEIYNRFESHRELTGKVLPVLTNQKVNTALKIIASLIGIEKKLSFHCSRHSFATLTLEQGIDLKTVSALMGHNTIKTTEIYAKLTRKRKADVINFLNAKSRKQDLKTKRKKK
jgi:site-specific recombinase XerD